MATTIPACKCCDKPPSCPCPREELRALLQKQLEKANGDTTHWAYTEGDFEKILCVHHGNKLLHHHKYCGRVIDEHNAHPEQRTKNGSAALRELTATLTNAVVQRLESRFLESTFGIGDIASVSSHKTEQNLRSAVRMTFENTCIVTGVVVMTEDEASDIMKVSHILPRKMANAGNFMREFAVRPEDIDHPKNFLLMIKNEKELFDHFGFCFVPDASRDGTFNKLIYDHANNTCSLSKEKKFVQHPSEGEQSKNGHIANPRCRPRSLCSLTSCHEST